MFVHVCKISGTGECGRSVCVYTHTHLEQRHEMLRVTRDVAARHGRQYFAQPQLHRHAFRSRKLCRTLRRTKALRQVQWTCDHSLSVDKHVRHIQQTLNTAAGAVET